MIIVVGPRPLVVLDGNGCTSGQGQTSVDSMPAQLAAALPNWDVTNLGVSGRTTAAMVTAFAGQVPALYQANHLRNVVVCWELDEHVAGGASAVDAAAKVAEYAGLARAAGFLVLVGTGVRTASEDANAIVRAGWAAYADGLCDFALRAELVDTGDDRFFQADGKNLTTRGATAAAAVVSNALMALGGGLGMTVVNGAALSLSALCLDLRADKEATASAWGDQSSESNDASQPTGAAWPTITTVDGLPAVLFGGVGDYMLAPVDVATGAKTIAISFKLTALPGASTKQTLLRFKNAAGKHCEILLCNHAGFRSISFLCDYTTAGATLVGFDFSLDLYAHTLVISYSALLSAFEDPSTYSAWLDGNRMTPILSGAVSVDATALGSVGGRAKASGSDGNHFDGAVARVLAREAASTDADINAIHDHLARGFAATPAWSPQVVCDGNSLTFGHGTETLASPYTVHNSFPEQLAVLLGGRDKWNVVNLGVSGQRTSNMLADLDSQVAPTFNARRPKNIIIAAEIGNAIFLGGSTALAAVQEFASFVSRARSAGHRVVTWTIPKRSDIVGANETARQAANVMLLAGASGADRVFDAAAMAEFQDTADTDNYTDGIHWTTSAAGAFAAGILSDVEAL